MQQGDIQIGNNFSVRIPRTSYRDWPEADRRRLLLRVDDACPGVPLPQVYATTRVRADLPPARGRAGMRCAAGDAAALLVVLAAGAAHAQPAPVHPRCASRRAGRRAVSPRRAGGRIEC